ncbi:anaerobic dimethyl sulfoxide reductase subunit B [Salmonella enterica subsp. arizonae]|nr:anaerobic dimethyl sulfoxide reductase subunit B [Salmonella enterica subsp. arizonae]
MTTQYGFFIDSSRCTGCKNLRAGLQGLQRFGPRMSASAAFMNMRAATGRKITASGTKTSSPIISPFRATTAKTRLYQSLSERRDAQAR